MKWKPRSLRSLLAACALVFSSLAPRSEGQMFWANLTGDQVVGPFGAEGDPGGPTPFSGSASFTFQPGMNGGSPMLSYEINLPGMDFDGNLTPGDFSDDITAIHVHIGAAGATGPHALNVFGFSAGQIREDDSDLMVDGSNSSLTGIWDDGDETLTEAGGTRQPFDSIALADAVDELMAEELYLQVHTISYPNGELRGQIQMIPEPSVTCLLGVVAVALFGMGRFTRSSK